VETWQDSDIVKLQADLKLLETQAVESEMELERNAWMQVITAMILLP